MDRFRPGMSVGSSELVSWAWRGPGVEAWHANHPDAGQVLLQIAVADHGKERLRRAAKVLTGVSHPGAARLVREALEDESPHLVLSAPRSGALRGPLPAALAVEATASVAAALSSVHASGVWGPDLRPATILGPATAPVITDWGAAWRGGMDPGEEPEGSVSRDIAGLGKLLYSLLTGLPPPVKDVDPGDGFAEPVRALIRKLTGPVAERPATAREAVFALRTLKTDPTASEGRPPERFAAPNAMLRRPRDDRPFAVGHAWGLLVFVLLACGAAGVFAGAVALLWLLAQ